ncbi:MAG: ATP-dependent sacrificial sulfur transferase LarE [Lachnospiraceae bacterium]|nr:ATP-dependent sacrificial sulfur transferase LarE [Lachnospiraceae bacterium]
MSLAGFLKENNKIALAFSGGVDSAYLLYAAARAGADVCAYFVKSEFQPQFELDDAKRLVDEINGVIKSKVFENVQASGNGTCVTMKIIELSALSDCDVKANGPKRCYYCKRVIFSAIMEAAHRDGYTLLIDGTNASDDVNDRPGMQALKELEVRSPLRECGITKAEVRKASKEAGLFTWDKPAYACLATRIPTGTRIDSADLEITEKAEGILTDMGFRDFRVRKMGNIARLQVTEPDFHKVVELKEEISSKLEPFYESIVLDLKLR